MKTPRALTGTDLDTTQELYGITLTGRERMLLTASRSLLTPRDSQEAYLLLDALQPMHCPACKYVLCRRSAGLPADGADGSHPDDAYKCPCCEAGLTLRMPTAGGTVFELSPGQTVTILPWPPASDRSGGDVRREEQR